MNLEGILPVNNPVFVFAFLLWSISWKGLALWRAAKFDQRNWFVIILVISSMGVVEIIYLFGFAKNKLSPKEIKSWLKRPSK